MADLRLVLVEDDDDHDQNFDDNDDLLGEGDLGMESSIDMINPEELFTPLARLRSYSVSDSIFNRRTITHDIPNILATLEESDDFITAIDCILKLSEDLEPSVRVELMEQIPYISHYYFNKLHMNDDNQSRLVAYRRAMITILVRYLTDVNNQVRKTGHMALIDIMECGYLTVEPFLEHIMPVIVSLTNEQHTPDDYRTEAVALGCKICRILGNEFTMNHFLPIFLSACEDDTLFHIRKVCASNITGLCEVLNLDIINSKLLPRFKDLCSDNVWGVRKSCAECFPDFAKYFTDEVLCRVLSPIFSDLLSDQSRWVRIAAFESLGPFISTFADTTKANITPFPENPPDLEKNENHEFNSFHYWREPLCDIMDTEFDVILNSDAPKNDEREELINGDEYQENEATTIAATEDMETETNIKHDMEAISTEMEDIHIYDNGEDSIKKNDADSAENFTVEDDETVKDESDFTEQVMQENSDSLLEHHHHVHDAIEMNHYSGGYETYGHYHDYGIFGDKCCMGFNEELEENNCTITSRKQDVIPQALLDNFISMTDPSRRQTVDCEIAKHCAFSLPGVAYTLGRDNWHCLKEAYQKLAGDVQWKVRHTIASSIHELAKILGEDLTSSDLVPIFNGFLKDLDEVRIGLLRHLSEFLQLLNPEIRVVYLYQLTDFLNIDNSRNWRFRSELSKQLARITELYSSEDINNYICPVALRLTSDRVVAVQRDAVDLIVTLLVKLESAIHTSSEQEIANKHFDAFVEQIATHLAKSAKWKDRRLYCNLCEALVQDGNAKLAPNTIVSNFIPHLHKLCDDKIVNVRICCARALRLTHDLFEKYCDKNIGDLRNILSQMDNDTDRDVQFYSTVSNLPPNSNLDGPVTQD